MVAERRLFGGRPLPSWQGTSPGASRWKVLVNLDGSYVIAIKGTLWFIRVVPRK